MALLVWFIAVIVNVFGSAYITNTASISSSLEEDTAVIPLLKVYQNNKRETTTSAVTMLIIEKLPPRTSSDYDYRTLQNINKTNTSFVGNTSSDGLVPNVSTFSPVSNISLIPESDINMVTGNNTQDNSFVIESTTEKNETYNDIEFAKRYLLKKSHNNSKKASQRESTTKESLYVPMVRLNVSRDIITNEIDTAEQIATTEGKRNTSAHQEYVETTSPEVYNPFYSPSITINNNTNIQKPEPKTIQNYIHIAGVNDTILYTVTKKNYSKKAHNNQTLNLMKLKTFFKKILNKKSNVPQNYKVYGLGTEEDHIMQIICENFGTCKVEKKNKIILKVKLNRLNEETETIIKSISAIKDLLVLPESQFNRSKSFHNAVERYSSVLKGTYNFTKNVTLTETQVSNVRINTQIFLKSLRNFAQCLKDIIKIMKVDKNHRKMYQKKNTVKKSSHEKLKALLKKYNLVQNSFMRRMYQLVNSFGKVTSTEKTNTQVSEGDEINNNDTVIERQPKKIIGNLKRLKNLAHMLSSKRVKRDAAVFGENALPYLLMLMKFMITKKYLNPLAPSTDNDGIDFLLDGIRNAPDIKSIRKNISKINLISSVTITPSAEDSSKDIDNETDNNRVVSQKDSKIIETILDDKNDTTDNDSIAAVDNRIFDNDMADLINDITYDNITSSTKKRSEEVDNNGFNKLINGSSIDNSIKSENGVDNEEDNPVIRVASDIDLPASNNSTESTIITNVPETRSNTSSSESEESNFDVLSSDKVSKSGRIEDNIDNDNDIQQLRFVKGTDSTRSASPVTSTATGSSVKSMDNNIKVYMAPSDEDLKKKSLESPEDVINKKEMTFLHSLDYETDKPEMEDTGAKEDSMSEDVELPLYFG